MPQTRSNPDSSEFVPIATDTVFLGDRSYSMKSTNGGSQEGAVEYMKNQYSNAMKMRSVKGNIVQYISFDNEAVNIYLGDGTGIVESDYDAVYEKMTPLGGTALYDAIYENLVGQMIRLDALKASLSREVKALVNDNPRLICASFAIMTDGMDNRSEHTETECKKMINKYKNEYGGVVLFIAANHDSEVYASRMGIEKDNALQMGNDRSSSIQAAKAVSFAQCRSASQATDDPVPMFTSYERSTSNSQPFSSGERSVCRSGGSIPFSPISQGFQFPPMDEKTEYGYMSNIPQVVLNKCGGTMLSNQIY
jgi:hypothetical protein